jgi:hypothetical protein
MSLKPGVSPPPNHEISKSAALHGRHLLELGFSIEQVVHNYGDVCQAVTELAEERGATLSISEFHTLNRCLDNAIAGAVSSWSEGREIALADDAGNAGELATVKGDLRKLVRQATLTLAVLRRGSVGIGGATGTSLERCLVEMSVALEKVREA